MRRDLFGPFEDVAKAVFQSTRLREARRAVLQAIEATASFNPRACVRRDEGCVYIRHHEC